MNGLNMLGTTFCRGVGMLTAAFFIGGCGAAQFTVPTPPVVGSPLLDPPRPPEPKAVANELKFGDLVDDPAGAPGATVAPDGRIAILPVNRAGAGLGTDAMVHGAMGLLSNLTGGEASKGAAAPGPTVPPDSSMLMEGLVRAGLSQVGATSDAVGRMVEDRLMRGLLRAGVTRFLGPEELGAIAARKVANRDGQITWQGTLDQLARVEPVTDAELLVAVRIDQAEAAELKSQVHWEHDPGALTAYRQAHQKFVADLTRQERAAHEASTAYSERCDAERARYKANGGSFALNGQEPPVSG